MTKKSQEESEQPAKVYQLDALGEQVKVLQETMKTGFDRVNANVNTLLVKSESQVTPQQLSDNLKAVRKEASDSLTEEVKKIHLIYGPLKDNNKWFIRAIVTQAVVIVGQLVFLVYITRQV